MLQSRTHGMLNRWSL